MSYKAEPRGFTCGISAVRDSTRLTGDTLGGYRSTRRDWYEQALTPQVAYVFLISLRLYYTLTVIWWK